MSVLLFDSRYRTFERSKTVEQEIGAAGGSVMSVARLSLLLLLEIPEMAPILALTC
jgi:hypothetical protein